MRLGIFQTLQLCSELKSYNDRVAFLRQHDNGALRTVLKYALDPHIVWDLPDTDPPFKECPYPGQELRLMSEARRLYLFLQGGNPNLNRVRREALYIELLESIHPEDAKLLNAAKNKKIPYKNVTTKLIKEAFPDLIEAGTEENEN
jgi:Family of unknown function (DUF6433)